MKIKKREWIYFQGALDIEFERDRCIGLGSTFGDGHTDRHFFLKHIFSSVLEFVYNISFRTRIQQKY